MEAEQSESEPNPYKPDVIIVGGGPAGCAVAVTTSRYGLDTILFDRGNAALRRCAFLENYLGFPGGIDVQTFHELIHDHVEQAGGELIPDLVESITRSDEQFRIETQEERVAIAPRVVAATPYDREYLRKLDTDAEMFEVHGQGDEEYVHIHRDFVDKDGHTAIDGLYVAGALGWKGAQALTAAGHGMRVGAELIADIRREQGYWEEAASYRDWRWKREALDHNWDDDDAWNQQFETYRVPENHDLDADRLREVREREIPQVKSTYIDSETVTQRVEQGQRQFLSHFDADCMLDVIDNERLREYVQELDETETPDTEGRT